MFKSILSFALLLVLLTGHPNAARAQIFQEKPELHGDIVILPIILIKVYPFIPGSVNGVSGKFMFDTGLKPAISLNDNFVVLANRKIQGRGQVGSGQSFNTSLTDTLQELKLSNGLTYQNLINVRSANYDFLQQHITTDFLGFIGHDFFSGYIFKLDYLHKNVTFYKNNKARSLSKDYLTNEKILAVIEFEIKKLPNMPIINVKIDNVNVLGTFDTGQNGSLQLDSISEQRLLKRRTVSASGKDSSGDIMLTVRNIRFNSKLQATLKGLERSSLEDTNVIRKAGNLTAANLMTIGYRFFSQYKTVWDYDNNKIYVMEY